MMHLYVHGQDLWTRRDVLILVVMDDALVQATKENKDFTNSKS